MKLHEYQAKALISEYGVAVPKGSVAATPQEAHEAAQRLGGRCVVKAQVHAGGRGKAGGVRLVTSASEAEQVAAGLLGKRLVTIQTGPGGAPVHKVLVEETLDVEKELYLGIVIDGSARAPVVIASSAGGMEIEDVAREHPELLLREVVDSVVGLRAFQGRRLAAGIGLPTAAANAFAQQASRLYQVFIAKDCSMVEINPLILTKDGRVIALDAKVSVDDDALFRHPELAELRDWSQEDDLEAKAGQARISYVKLDGDVGCVVNGAGLAMATMDIVRAAGFQPANFLDVGGGADPDRVAQTIGILLDDPKVKRILVNVFGGIARCDDIALGIVKAIPASQHRIPIVVRFLGTNMEEGKRILQQSGLNTHFVDSLAEATEVLRGLAKA
ncbi:MAG: ADP-forming succinate--CoA ligase subunit beta [Dehalococcoidia bacterium]|nr:ADP-forming succinate--CoA ligase subunit beta [Dehalococcoidia bacterium]